MYRKKNFLKKVSCGILAALMLILPSQAAGLVKENQIHVIEKNSSKGEMTVAITYPSLADESSRVLVPVWTDKNGQDDIIWYNATLGANGWQVTVNFNDHKQESGLYHLHFYGQDSKGNLRLLGGIKETLEYTPEAEQPNVPPTDGKPKVEVAVSNGKATLTLSNATNLSNDTVVYFPSWGQKNGQNDIVWYLGSYVSQGKWQVTLDSEDHGEQGFYTTHVYAQTNAGLTLVANTDFEIKAQEAQPPQNEEKMQIFATKNAEETAFTIDLENYEPMGTVYFAVWGEIDGQNDIIWYPAQSSGQKTWTLVVNTTDHEDEKGTYNVHVYDMHTGADLVTHTTCNLKKEELPKQEETKYSSGGIKLASKDPVAGTFTMTVKNVQCNKAIKQVYIVIWSDAGDQDDIIWYEAKQNGTDWTTIVNTKANHGNHRGKYHAHAYLNTEDDELFLLGGAKPFLEWKTAQGVPGIDVSIWQGTIDWKQVKAVGVEFAMIRSSYGFEKEEVTTITSHEENQADGIAGHSLIMTANVEDEDKEEDSRPNGAIDTNFVYNIQQAKKNGIKVGVYHYSYAETVEEVLKEAELCLGALKSAGVSLDYPIAFDIEEASRFNAEEIANNNDMIKAFCDAVEAAGYDAVVYGNPYLFNNYVDYSLIQNYGIWMANWTYNDAGSYGNYDNVQLWQYSNEGSLDGIYGPVDLNIGFMN